MTTITEQNKETPLDIPFTVKEKIKATIIVVIMIPWLFWFPLLLVGGLIRTYPVFPRFPGLWLTPCILTIAYSISWAMIHNRPRIIRERLRRSHLTGSKPGEPNAEKRAQSILMILCIAMLLISAYDAAGREVALPTLAYMIGSTSLLISLTFVAFVLRVNSWASKVVYKQKGQQLITKGPYAIVRHPFYTFFTGFLIGLPLIIGSYWGVIPGALCIPTLMWRAFHEEKFLLQEFGEEYQQYQTQVHFRMFPGIY